METTKLDNGQDLIVWEQDLEFPYFINKNGQTGWIADFLDRFYRNVFEMNIKMLNNEKRREFPIAYCKTQAIPMFANAVGRLTPYYIGKAIPSTEADLWCYFDEQDERGQEVGDVLMYFEHERLNLNGNAELELQCTTKKDRVELCRFKVDFFNICVHYPDGKEPENLLSTDFFDEKVWSRIKPHGSFICSVMDLRSSIKKKSQQLFLEPGANYSAASNNDWHGKILPFMVSVAVIEDLRG